MNALNLIASLFGKKTVDPNAPVQGATSTMIPQLERPEFYNRPADLEKTADYWTKQLYSDPPTINAWMKPKGYPRGLIAGCHSGAPVPDYMPMADWFSNEALPPGYDHFAPPNTIQTLHERISRDAFGKWKVSMAACHLITAILFVKGELFERHLDLALPKKIKEIGGDTIALQSGRHQLSKHAEEAIRDWTRLVIRPFALDMFLKFRKEPAFIRAIHANGTQPLVAWFRNKLSDDEGAKLVHCLRKPWGKAICINALLHKESGTTAQEKEFFKNCRIWAMTLVATLCATVYAETLQMSAAQTRPQEDWKKVEETFKSAPTQAIGKKMMLDFNMLPASPVFGKQTRVMSRRAGHDPGMDEVDSDDELFQDLPW